MDINPGIIELKKAAEIIAENLGQSIIQRGVIDTQALLQSLDWKVIGNTIHILYNYYGMYPDMGVGRGVKIADVRDFSSKRKRKRWYAKTMFREVARLSEKVAKLTGLRGVEVVADVKSEMKL